MRWQTTRAICNERRVHGVMCNERLVQWRASDVGRRDDGLPLDSLPPASRFGDALFHRGRPLHGSGRLPRESGFAAWHHEYLALGEVGGNSGRHGRHCDERRRRMPERAEVRQREA